MVHLAEHFANEGRGRESEWARQRHWFIKAKHDNQRREEIADKIDDTATALSTAVVVASQAQVTDFKVKLDTYDTATVQTLIENQELLDAVNVKIKMMLGQAYVMEDGRRVFRTENGEQVFDEHGTEVGPEELDPDVIDPTAPTWEAFSEAVEEEAKLTAERSDILEFQEKVDAARERVDGDEISEADLAELDADLLDAMPDSVRQHVPELAPSLETQPVTQATSPATRNFGDGMGTPAPAPV